ncbi:DsrE/DsrF-like family protein [Rubripirellula lacrimiformis]|uniref:DsrE/DsrF-like family protein n=1 Tax=Rubripirellula lacrimiformis TaxID=1930273 RepID=A0A517NCF9_9BACT|nr:DsrE family protein [Rubripirellula lacrimiformis]QDT04796.1 DsrE/DsrF-like family protein [Rubripirellula lacrimiformis]
MNRFPLLIVIGCCCTLLSAAAWSQDNQSRGQGHGQGHGPGFGAGRGQGLGPGRGMGRGAGRAAGQGRQGQAQHEAAPATENHGHHGHDDRHDEDRSVFQYLLQNHQQIRRTVKELPNGVETLTESDVPEIASKIKEHVEWMEYRIENTNPIRMRDPLFAEIFKHTDKIKMIHEDTEKGVRVTETSDDAYVAKLIQAHAKAVSGFVEHGFAEAMKNHAVPSQQPATAVGTSHPAIAGHGAVVQLPVAAMQPRTGTKLLVDITRGSDPGELNNALEKVAKYLNIYAGGGAEPASAQIALVFHGDATLAVLNSDAYAEKFSTDENPNLDLLRQLHEADVEMYVCGQTLISKGSSPKDVAVFVQTAVSALTAVVNLQADGYAYLPLGK